MDKETADITHACHIRIAVDGRWYYEGLEIIHPAVLESFFEMLERDDRGRYRIRSDRETCYIEVEDTPFVVSAIRGDNESVIRVILNSLRVHELDPERLYCGKDNVLYMNLPDGIPVRFSRSAYYALALMMEADETGQPFLRMAGSLHDLSHLMKNGDNHD